MSKLIMPLMVLQDQLDNPNESLNSGSELDDNEISYLSNPLELVDVSDIHENIGTITALENRITDLLYLADDIEKAAGMNQSFAMEAEKLLGDIGSKTPIGYYSKETTATRYKVSLEEISKGIWVLIAAAVTAVIVMIAKFISWLRNGSSGGSGGSISSISETINADIEKREKADEIIKDMDTLVKSKDLIKQTNIDSLLHEYVNGKGKETSIGKLLLMENPIFHDIMFGGKYSKLIDTLKDSLPDIINDGVHKQISTLEALAKKAVEEAKKDVKDIDLNIKELEDVKIEIKNFGHVPIPDLHDYVEKLIRDVKESKISIYTNFTLLNELFKTSFIKSIPDIINRYEEGIIEEQKNLEKVLSIINSLIQFGSMSDKDLHNYANALKLMSTKISKDIVASLGMISYIRQYINYSQSLNTHLITVQKAAINIIEEEIKLHHGSVPDEFKALHKELIAALK